MDPHSRANMHQSIKGAARDMMSAGLYYSGIVTFCQKRRRDRRGGRIVILAYHNIGNGSLLDLDVPEEVFRAHVEWLLESGHRIISLEELIHFVREGRRPSDDVVAITFDDGYRSMYTSVLPVVRDYGIPVTVFVALEPVETRVPLFADMLIYAVEHTRERELDLSDWGLSRYTLYPPKTREWMLREINALGKMSSRENRDRLTKDIFDRLQVRRDDPAFSGMMLNWDEMKEMHEAGVTFGAHTLTHPLLSRIPLADAAREIAESRRILRMRLDADVAFFAYPYGGPDCYTSDVVRAVADSGFAGAVTLGGGDVSPGDDTYLLKRECISHGTVLRPTHLFARAAFATRVSGVWHHICAARRFLETRTIARRSLHAQ